MRWYDWIIIIVLNVLVSYTVSNVVVYNHSREYLHLDDPCSYDGYCTGGQDNLEGDQYIEYKRDYQPEDYDYNARYISYEIPTRVEYTEWAVYKNGSWSDSTSYCYDDGSKINCSGG